MSPFVCPCGGGEAYEYYEFRQGYGGWRVFLFLGDVLSAWSLKWKWKISQIDVFCGIIFGEFCQIFVPQKLIPLGYSLSRLLKHLWWTMLYWRLHKLGETIITDLRVILTLIFAGINFRGNKSFREWRFLAHQIWLQWRSLEIQESRKIKFTLVQYTDVCTTISTFYTKVGYLIPTNPFYQVLQRCKGNHICNSSQHENSHLGMISSKKMFGKTSATRHTVGTWFGNSVGSGSRGWKWFWEWACLLFCWGYNFYKQLCC